MPDTRVDPERPRETKPFNSAHGHSGEEYDRERETAQGEREAEPAAPAPDDHPDLPTHNGARASIDQATGAVRGAGRAAGGGQGGEDLSSDAAAGDGYPLTGGEGEDHAPGDLGPRNDKASYL
jgi:hypothetical protein